MKIGERIKQLREVKNLRQKELAAKINVSSQSISMWESGLRNPNPTQRQKLCKFFNISEAELFGELPKPIEIKETKIPVVSYAKGGPETGFEFEAREPIEYINFKDCEAVEVLSNSMAPLVYKGQFIIYSKTASFHNGDLIYCKLKEGGSYFKRYFKNKRNKTITLQSVNPTEPIEPLIIEESEVEFMYKVVGVRF